MMFSPLRLARTASVLALVLAASALAPVFAQDAAPAAEAPAAEAPAAAEPAAVTPETVVATVGGEAITEADLSFAAEDLTTELQQMPPEQRKPFLLRVLIDMKVMAAAGRKDGMAETPLFQQRLNYLEDRALRRAYFAETIANAVTEEAVRASYDKLVAGFVPAEEIRASHILVASEEEAKAIKAELDGGADFATIAKEKSIDPGAANGGDLGFFGKGMMVAPFEATAYALTDIGQVSDPVQSQFGWHIIRLEEKRKSAPPAFETVASQLQQQLMMTTFDDTVAKLMEGVQIDIPDAALAAAVAEQTETDAAAEESAPAAQ
jgi:peptidyl-prolyl cis-trans isomerase C